MLKIFACCKIVSYICSMGIADYLTISEYAKKKGFTRQRIQQLVKAKLIDYVELEGKKVIIHKNAKIKPSGKKIGRPKKSKKK